LERAAVISEINDGFGGVWTDAGESFELSDCGGVEVDGLGGGSFLGEGDFEAKKKNGGGAGDQKQSRRTEFWVASHIDESHVATCGTGRNACATRNLLPQRLKPHFPSQVAARLKSCPDERFITEFAALIGGASLRVARARPRETMRNLRHALAPTERRRVLLVVICCVFGYWAE
jgi:hypothetical protein